MRLDKTVKDVYTKCIRSPVLHIHKPHPIKPNKVEVTLPLSFIKLYKVRGDWQDSPLPSSPVFYS